MLVPRVLSHRTHEGVVAFDGRQQYLQGNIRLGVQQVRWFHLESWRHFTWGVGGHIFLLQKKTFYFIIYFLQISIFATSFFKPKNIS